MKASTLGGAAVLLAFLAAAPAAADDPSPTPHPTTTHRAHHSPRPAGAGPAADHVATPVPVDSGSRLSGLLGVDGRVVALGSILGLGVLIGVLGLRRD